MKITKISILNFYGLSAFRADKLGKLNRLTGDNGVGKSAVVLAIKEAFKSSGVDPFMIKAGADKAEILIEVDQKMLINRQITQTANNVNVTVDGQPVNKPQTYLTSLLGLGSNFNPVDFFSPKQPKGMTPERYRRELLLSAMPFNVTPDDLQKILWPDGQPDLSGYIEWDNIDFSQHGLIVLTEIQKQIYERRHEIGVDVTRQTKSIEQDKLDLPPTVNAERFKGFDLNKKVGELSAAKVAIGQQESDIQSLGNLRKRAESISDEIEHHKQEILRLESELQGTRETGVKLKEKIEAFVAPEVTTLEADVAQYETYQKLIHRLNDIERRQKQLEQTSTERDALDELYKSLTTKVPKRILADIKLPVDGLEIDGDNILINGVAIDKLSDSEKIKLGLDIARALSGKLKVICIDRFESLDGKAKKLFEKAARDDDFEYFFTIVNQDPNGSGDLRLEVEGETENELPLAKTTTKTKAGF